MSFGLRVWDASGNLSLDIADRITRLLYSTVLSAASSGTISIPGITTSNAGATTIPYNITDLKKLPHRVWITNDTINYEAMPVPGDGTTPDIRCDTLLHVFKYR